MRIDRPSLTRPVRWIAAVSAALSLALAACGGGGGADGGIGGTGGGGSGGGIGGTGVAYGEITGFGSIWVNGVRYDTSGASFRRDDDSVSQSDLRVGMVARVEGSAASATRVSVDSALKGRVESATGDTYVVMGQTVQTDAGTAFDDGLRPAPGDVVEVHGLPRAPGVLAASYVERQSALATPPFVVTGFVSAHDTAAATLTIGALTVAYGGAAVEDLPAGSWVGLVVEAKGSVCSGTPVCGTLTATKVEPSGPRIASSPEAEIEGYVSALTADGFLLGAQRVVVTAGTRYEDGTAADLVVGAKVEAEGPVSDGVLTALEVEFKAGVRVEADVLAIVGDRLTLVGLPGLEVQVTAQTELDDLGSLAELQPGQHVRLRGRPVGGALVVATELEVRDADADVELRAGVTSAADPLLTLLGVTIDTGGLPDSAFRDDDAVIGRAAFFAALAGDGAGRSVSAKGRLGGGAVVWRELELDD